VDDPNAPLAFTLNGEPVKVRDVAASLLDVLRGELGVISVKDGCSPQGQCGCCTVLVDGAPRVACVTPARRVAGRSVTTVEGLPEAERWAEALCATGGSQCGFCTPGIIVRLAGVAARAPLTAAAVDQALLAHLCRCTGWQTIREAAAIMASGATSTPSRVEPGPAGRTSLPAPVVGVSAPVPTELPVPPASIGMRAVRRSREAAETRAALEGHGSQHVGPPVALGLGGFADDSAPPGALVAMPAGQLPPVPHGDGRMPRGWVVADSVAAVRRTGAKVQGRRTTVEPTAPLPVPPGRWTVTLQTGWVEPAYLETDASWCQAGAEAASPLGNGGAFGGKLAATAPGMARGLADHHGRPVRVLLSREDTVRLGPKRPPLAAGIRADGTGVVRVVRTPGIAAAIASVAPGLVVEEVDVPGPPTSAALRAAGWAEALVLLAGAAGKAGPVVAPNGAEAEAAVDLDTGEVRVRVACGDPLDEVVLRSYCIGAAHMALGWVTSEGLAVDAGGTVLDLTIRSFGILRALDTPRITVDIEPDQGAAVNGSDAVFAAVAAATWVAQGCPPVWPTGRPVRRIE
jgi:xanthine dehydrogenase small subunit